MSDREYRDDCTCASCIAVDVEMHRFAVRSMGDGRKLVDVSYRERALAAEALVRAKDEAIGELLGLLDGSPQPLSEVVKQPGQGPFGLPLDACHQCGRTGGSHGEMCASW
jgi:hypothetical protein